LKSGGEEGIRTLEKLLTSTPLAGERLRPLGHLSVVAVDKEKDGHNQQAILPERKKLAAFVTIRFANPKSALGIACRNRLPKSLDQGSAGGAQTPILNRTFPGQSNSCLLCNRHSG
jgi:hypothetical protein